MEFMTADALPFRQKQRILFGNFDIPKTRRPSGIHTSGINDADHRIFFAFYVCNILMQIHESAALGNKRHSAFESVPHGFKHRKVFGKFL